MMMKESYEEAYQQKEQAASASKKSKHNSPIHEVITMNIALGPKNLGLDPTLE